MISVIVPTFRRFEPALRTLSDLLQQDHDRFEVIVADQNRSWPLELEAQLDVIRADRRVNWMTLTIPGVVIARNHAVSAAAGSLLVFVDDDVWIPDRSFLRQHERAHEDASVACVCGREVKMYDVDQERCMPVTPPGHATMAPAGGTRLSQLLHFDRSQTLRAEVAVFSTCNGSINRAAFDRVGGFDEHFRGASYGDDADLALRLASAGERITYDPHPWLVHLHEPVGGLRLSDPNNPFSEYDRCLRSEERRVGKECRL